MKKAIKGFIVGIIVTTLLMSTVLGANVKEKIEVVFDSINLTVNSKKVDVPNILYKGTTYVPIRAVGEILDKEVGWDSDSRTASINDKGFNDGGGGKYTDEKHFSFDDETGEIVAYSDFGPKDVVIPKEINGVAVKKIDDNSFEDKRIKSVIIPNTIEIIGDNAFKDNNIKNLVIPNNIKEIGRSAFKDNNISNLRIEDGGDSILNIGDSSFSDNKLTTLVIPSRTRIIGSNSFANNQLEELDILEGVVEIIYGAFKHNLLTSIEIPNTVEHLSGFNNNKLSNIDIPNKVTTIGGDAFRSNNLTSVIIPEGVNLIGPSAFSGNRIIDLSLPDSVTEIHGYAFTGAKLSHIDLPKNIKIIGICAFANSGLESITIPESVEYIGEYAFAHNGFEDRGYIDVIIPDIVLERLDWRNSSMGFVLLDTIFTDGKIVISA